MLAAVQTKSVTQDTVCQSRAQRITGNMLSLFQIRKTRSFRVTSAYKGLFRMDRLQNHAKRYRMENNVVMTMQMMVDAMRQKSARMENGAPPF